MTSKNSLQQNKNSDRYGKICAAIGKVLSYRHIPVTDSDFLRYLNHWYEIGVKGEPCKGEEVRWGGASVNGMFKKTHVTHDDHQMMFSWVVCISCRPVCIIQECSD